MKKGLILLGLLVVIAGCGQKSNIRNYVEAQRLGDGEHLTQDIVLPLSDKAISSYRSDVDNIEPLFRGFVSTMMNLGATMGAGKTRLSLIQPIPEIPKEYLSSLKIKRILFFIEANKENQNFKFLRRIAVKMSSFNLDSEINSWEPIIETDSLNDNEQSFLKKLFTSRNREAEEWDRDSKGLMLIRYNQEEKVEALQSASAGKIFILEAGRPNETRKYLEKEHKDFYQRLHVLNKSILIELKKDPIAAEVFKSRINQDAEKVAELEIGEIKPCTDNVCLDLKVPDINLLPLIRQGNAIKIDAYIDPRKAPKSFQLKGFVEFEVKIPTKI